MLVIHYQLDYQTVCFYRDVAQNISYKGQAEPSHLLEDHLGYGIDTARGLFLLTARREAKLRLGATALLFRAARHHRLVRARELASVPFAGPAWHRHATATHRGSL